MKKLHKENKRTLEKRKKDAIFVASIAALPLLQYLIFYVYVNINSVVLAFKIFDADAGGYIWYGLGNFDNFYRTMFSDGLLVSCLKNSLVFYVLNTVAGTVGSLFFSYYIFKQRKAHKLFKIMLFLPSIISSIVLVLIFKYFTDYAIPSLFNSLFDISIRPLVSTRATTFASVIFFGIWIGFGTSILMYSGAMGNVSESAVEAAKIDGASEIRQFWHVVLPLIYPTITVFLVAGVAGLFTSDMNLFSFFGVTAERYVWTFGYYLLKNTRLATMSEYPFLASVGVVLTVVAIPLTFGVRTLLRRLGPSAD